MASNGEARPVTAYPTTAETDDLVLARDRSIVGADLAAQAPDSRAIEVSLHDDLASVEIEWRRFEETADCTAFQTYLYLSAWQRHIGGPTGTVPLVVLGRRPDGSLAFILPLAFDRKWGLGRLRWLGQELVDYTGPLLAADFSATGGLGSFVRTWGAVQRCIRADRRFRYDLVDFRKMPDRVGPQFNPFCYLGVSMHPAGAHLTTLSGDWTAFYAAKRSSSTRSRDRSKVKRLAGVGEIAFVSPTSDADIERTLDTMFEQKRAFFDRVGVPDVFARPGYREFYLDISTDPRMRGLVHVARLDVGPDIAAANLGLEFKGRYYYVIASYSPGELQKFGPGAVHLRELLKRAIEHGCHEFDFTIGDESYKSDWSDTDFKLYDYLAPATPLGFPATETFRLLQRSKRFIKQTPVLWDAFQRLRAWRAKSEPTPTKAD
jgi:CelD/BcsL family acetyltransferase involved in cellulose biosynthesis